MVKKQLEARGISDPHVIDAMSTIPREKFVLPEAEALAYSDNPLLIDCGQTISQPYIVALMIQIADLTQESKVLDVGTGSGYAAAVLSQIVREVHTIEFHAELSKKAEKTIQSLGYHNIHFHIGDGRLGLPEFAPFDAILVAAAADDAPKALLEQKAINGSLIIPLGNSLEQTLTKIKRIEKGKFVKSTFGSVCFVPLVRPNSS